MPVTATPYAPSVTQPQCSGDEVGGSANLPPVACRDQNVIVAAQSTTRGKPNLTKIQAVRISGGRDVYVEWTMRDAQGNPVDLRCCVCPSQCSSSMSENDSLSAPGSASSEADDCPYSLVFRLHEHITLGCRSGCECVGEAEVELVDASQGKVKIHFTTDITKRPGIYFGELALTETQGDDTIVFFSNTFYVVIDRGIFSGDNAVFGPPTMPEIRLHLRDSGPEDNYLLDNVKFDDAEIAAAITHTVSYWNERPPDVQRFSTQTFPYRYHWLEGIAGYLFQLAAENYRANNLTYSAAGLSVNDMDKEPNYERAAQMRLEVWRKFVRDKKAEINLNMGFGGIGSTYGRGSW